MARREKKKKKKKSHIEWHERAVLSAHEREEAWALAARCNAHDGTDLKLTYGQPGARPANIPFCVLAYVAGRLVGYCAADVGGDDEIAGMVDPDARRRGIGRELLRRVLAGSWRRGRGSALLITEEAVPAGAALAQSMGGELEMAELRLGLLTPEDLVATAGKAAGQVTLRPATEADENTMAEILASGFNERSVEHTRATIHAELHSARYLLGEAEGRPVGTLKVYVDPPRRASIYGFAVGAADQGRGYGREILIQTLALLLNEGYLPITLEVLHENDRARALYTSSGMRPITTYAYYRLPTAE